LFLIIVAAGILSYGIGALQTVGWLPGHNHRAFDVTAALDWSAWYGQILQGVFNVTPTPTVLQLLAWLTYLVVVVALFLRNRGGVAGKPAPASAPTGVSVAPAA
jgi:high-affinity iron transporter